MSATSYIDPTTRRAPRAGAFNLTIVRIELVRMLRNRRTLFFALVLPTMLFLIFSASASGDDTDIAHGNIAAYVMVSMALYGAALTAASAGSSVALERATGWSRQLRLTPLNPGVYIAVKGLMALLLGGIALAVVNVAGLIQHKASMPADRWVACALLTLACASVFAAMGLFVGYLVPGENAMQVLGPGLAILSFLGDLFIPLKDGSTIYRIAEFTPMFGVAHISRWPLTGDIDWVDFVNALFWLGLFAAGAAWRMSKDTARV